MRYRQALNINMAVAFEKLFEKDDLQSYFVKGLEKTFLIIFDLGKSVLVKTDVGLFVVNRRKDKMEVSFEGFMLRQGQIDIVRCT